MEKRITYFTKKAIIAGVIIGVVQTVYWSLGMAMPRSWYSWHDNSAVLGAGRKFISWDQPQYMMTMGFEITLVLVIIAIINQIARRNVFSAGEAAVITTLASLSILLKMASWSTGYVTLFGVNAGAYIAGDPVEKIWPLSSPLLGPMDKKYIDAMLLPGAAVNWGYWIGPIGWVILYSLSWVITFGFLGLLFHRLWLDVERVPFPSAEFHVSLIKMTQIEGDGGEKSGKIGFFRNKFFLMGFILCFLWWFIAYGKFIYVPGWPGWSDPRSLGLFPGVWAPGTLPWEGAPQIDPAKDFSRVGAGLIPLSLGLYYVGLYINLGPWEIAWGFLNSIPNILGLVVGTLILVILMPPIMTRLGFYGLQSSQSFFDMEWQMAFYRGVAFVGTERNNLWGTFFMFGAVSALIIYPMIRNRSQVAAIVKTLWSKPSPELEAESPLPYRVIWLGFLGGAVGMILSMAAINIPLQGFILWALAYGWIFLCISKMLIETGGGYGDALIDGRWPQWMVWPLAISMMITVMLGLNQAVNSANFMWFVFFPFGIEMFAHWKQYWMYRSPQTFLHNVKVATENKVDVKKLMKWSLIVVVVAFVISPFIDVIFAHLINMQRTAVNAFNGRTMNRQYTELVRKGVGFQSYMLPQDAPLKNFSFILLGLAITCALYFIRARFPKFMIGAAGFVLSMFVGPAVWSSWLVALVIKYLVIKIGGMKLYNEKAQPFFIGCLAGWFLCVWLLYFAISVPYWMYLF